MAYVYPNYKTKKAFKEAVIRGDEMIIRENTPFGNPVFENGTTSVEGPHYPEPHRWYASVVVRDRKVQAVK